MNNHFLQGKIAPALISFSIPLMLSLILQALYGAVDLAIVGKFSNTANVAAVATGSQVMICVTGIIVGLTTGGSVLVALGIGAKDSKKVEDVIASLIKVMGVVVIILTTLLILFARELTKLLNVQTIAFEQTVSYIIICAGGILFITIYNALAGVFRGMGNSKLPLVFIAIACAVNIILDIVFVAILNLGATGAAIATVLAQAVSVVFSLYYIRKSNFPFTLTKHSLYHTRSCKSILRIGIPIALQDFLTNISFLIIAAIMNSMGVVAAASLGISSKSFVFLAVVPMAFLSALSAFVSQNMGANNPKRAKRALKVACLISFASGCIMFIITHFGGEYLASIFEKDPAVIKGATAYIKGCSFEHFFVSLSFCLIGYFNGQGKTSFSMIQGLIAAFLVRIPLSYYFSTIPNVDLYTMGLPVSISAAVTFILCAGYYYFNTRKFSVQQA